MVAVVLAAMEMGVVATAEVVLPAAKVAVAESEGLWEARMAARAVATPARVAKAAAAAMVTAVGGALVFALVNTAVRTVEEAVTATVMMTVMGLRMQTIVVRCLPTQAAT